MRKPSTRAISIALVIVMVLSLLPLSAFAAETTARVRQWGVTLNDRIGVKFCVEIPAEDVASTVVNLTVAGDTVSKIASEATILDGSYVFTADLAAAQMTDQITLSVVTGGTEVFTGNYSVRQYAETILAGNYQQNVKDMVLQMLHYGAAAQTYFKYNLSAMANAGYEDTYVEGTIPTPDDVDALNVNGSVDGIKFYGATLLFESKIALRYYYKVDGKVEDYTFKVGETKYTAVESDNGLYYVEVPGRNPHELNQQVTVDVTDGDGNLSVTYGPMNYISRMAENGSEKLLPLLKALCAYQTEAVEYVGSGSEDPIVPVETETPIDPNKYTVEVTYLDGTKDTLVSSSSSYYGFLNMVDQSRMDHELFRFNLFLNGKRVTGASDWSIQKGVKNTLEIRYNTFSTNKVPGGGVEVEGLKTANSVVTLTGVSGNGPFADEVNPVNANEQVWPGHAYRGIYTKNDSTTFVLKATFKPTRLDGEFFGFMLRDLPAAAVVGIDKNGNVRASSHKGGSYTLDLVGTPEPITVGQNVEMALARSGDNFYLYVGNKLRASFTTTNTGSYGIASGFDEYVGFGQVGRNTVEISNITHATGASAVAPYLPQKEGTLNVTYLDGTTAAIPTKQGEGLQQELNGPMTNEVLGVIAYLNGEKVTLTDGWDQNLTGTNTLEFRYDSRTTNTVPGTGIAVNADGTVVLTGRLEDGKYTDEFHPINNEELWVGNTRRAIWTANTGTTYVLSATFKPTNFTGGAIGFGLWDQNSVATIGVTNTGAVFARSFKAHNYTGITTYGTAVAPTVGEEITMTLVRQGTNFYLFVDNQLRATFTSTAAGEWANAAFSTKVGFAQQGQNVVEISNYTYTAGETAAEDYLNGKETWMQQLAGKNVSIIGDSISTYKGVSNSTDYRPDMGNNAVFYDENWLKLEDTYWMQLINRYGMKLCVNNSWSGSTIRNGGVASGIYRADKLHREDGTTPDIIVVFLGINDLNSSLSVEATQQGYQTMLLTMKEAYPNAQVFCLGMPNRYVGDDNAIAYNNAFINAIKAAGENFHYVDLFNSEMRDEVYAQNSTNDNLHPNAIGMDYFTDVLATSLKAHYDGLTTQVEYTYMDGSKETISATWGEGLASQPTGEVPDEDVFVGMYVNGCAVGLTQDWDKYLLSDTTIEYKEVMTTTTTNKVPGTGIAMAEDGTIILTGAPYAGTYPDEVNFVNPDETVWHDMVYRGAWTTNIKDTYVLKATFKPTRLDGEFFGFALSDSPAPIAVVGINQTGNIRAFSRRGGVYNLTLLGTPEPIATNQSVEMTLVRSGNEFYLYVGDELRAYFKTTNTGSWNIDSNFGTNVGFGLVGRNDVEITNYSYTSEEAAVEQYLPEKNGTLNVTYLDGTTSSIATIWGEGLKQELDGPMTSEIFGVVTYLNGKQVTLTAGWDKYLSGTNTLEFRYESRTTNAVYGTGIAVNADGTVVLTGRLDGGQYTDEFSPLNNERLWAGNTRRTLWTTNTSDTYVLSATFKPTNFTGGAIGFGLWDQNSVATIGVTNTGAIFARSFRAADYKLTQYGTATPITAGDEVKMTLVRNGNNFYLFVENELRATFTSTVAGAWASAAFSTQVGFAQYGQNIVEISNYTYTAGEAAAEDYLTKLEGSLEVTYLDGTKATITTKQGEGLQQELNGSMTSEIFGVVTYLNGKQVTLTDGWDQNLSGTNTLEFRYESRTTNAVYGNGIAVNADGTVVLTGRLDGGQYTDEFSPINNERLWAGATRRTLWTTNTSDTYVLSATFKPTNFTSGAIGFGLWDQNSVAIIGITSSGTIVGTSFKASYYKLTQHGTATPITAGDEVKMTLVRNGNNFYLFVENELCATFTTTVAGTWANATFSTKVGFAQYGQNIVEVSNYTYTAGEAAAEDYLTKLEGSLEVTYLDGTKATITTKQGEGLQQELNGSMTSEIFGVVTYLNGKQVTLTDGWDQNLSGTNTLEFRYESRTTNVVPGTGIAVNTDGTIVLTGRIGSGQFADEVSPLNNEKLWVGNTRRTLWTTNTSDTYVLSATFKPTNFTGGAIGFGLWDQNSVATIGVTNTGAIFARSFRAADYKITQHGTAKAIAVGEEVTMTLIRQGVDFYLLVDGELRATFTSTVAGAWATAAFSTKVGFAQYGQNIVEISNYSYSTTLPAQNVAVIYPDGTSEEITAQWGVGLTKQPAEVNSVIYSMYLNDEKITDLAAATKYLVEDAVLTWKYDSRTTNVVPGTGIAVNTDGTIVLTGRIGSGQFADEVSPLNNEKLWVGNTRRTLWTTNTSDTYVLSATFKPTNFTGGAIGFGLWDQNSVATIGVTNTGAIFARSFRAADYKITQHGTATPITVGEEVKLTLARNGNNFYLYVNDELRATFTSTVAGTWATAAFSTKVGFAQYGQNISEISNYTYASGYEAVAPYIPAE